MAPAEAVSLLWALAAGGAAGWLLRGRGAWQRRRRRLPPAPGQPWPLPSEQLRQWLEALPQGWLVLAPDGRLSALNPRAEQLLDLQRQQALPALALLGQPLSALEPGEDVLHLVDLARERAVPQRGRWLRPSGDLELRVLPGGDGWVAVLLEGRNPLQRQLQRQEAWVGDVAHELRTPITALMLVGDSLAARLEGQPQAQLLVERLLKELRRLQELVSDLLALSRLENTPVAEANRQSAVDPRDVLGSVWAVLEPLASQRGVGLRVDPGRDQARLAAVDPARLHQALLNLLDNALRYSPDGSRIEVSVEHRDRWCLIGVRDHGPGLSGSDLERMFERFYRGDPSRARAPRVGSGLGLPIVQQIALSQGGLVRASNHPDGGAQLELLLPRA
ncbi:MAG: sensor histidine kinase [Vulcanococcus sp.]